MIGGAAMTDFTKYPSSRENWGLRPVPRSAWSALSAMPIPFRMHARLTAALSLALVSLAVASAAGQSNVPFDPPEKKKSLAPATKPDQAGDVYQTLPVVKLVGVKRAFAIAADENTAYLSLCESNEILVVDLAGKKVTATLKDCTTPGPLLLHGNRLVVACENGDVTAFDTGTLKVTTTVNLGKRAYILTAASAAPDWCVLVAAETASGHKVVKIATTGGRLLHETPIEAPALTLLPGYFKPGEPNDSSHFTVLLSGGRISQYKHGEAKPVFGITEATLAQATTLALWRGRKKAAIGDEGVEKLIALTAKGKVLMFGGMAVESQAEFDCGPSPSEVRFLTADRVLIGGGSLDKAGTVEIFARKAGKAFTRQHRADSSATSAAATMPVGPMASSRVRWLVARNTAEGVDLHQYKLAGN